jgi:Uma2 family endonuclease
MSNVAKRQATYDDLLALPDNVVGEIVDGELIASPRPAIPHARAGSVLGGVLGGLFDHGRGGPGGWWILFEPELHLGADVLVPDLAGWRRSRLPALAVAPYFTLAPDWVCEILSPSTALLDRTRKLHVYAREGVGHLWFLDPTAQTLEVFRRAAEGWLLVTTFARDDRARAEPFDAIEIELASLWLAPAPQ